MGAPARRLEARVGRDEANARSRLEGFLVRGDERVELSRLELVLTAGWFFHGARLARFDARGAERWAVACWREGPRVVPLGDEAELFDELGRIAGRPLIQLDAAVLLAPTPRLFIEAARDGGPLPCRLAFDYDGVEVEPGDPRRVLFDAERRRACERREEDEAAARALLVASGAVARPLASGAERFELEPAALPAAVRALLAAGWVVEASGRRVRAATRSSFQVSSGRDWFELSGGIDFDEVHAPVAGLAALARRRELFVRLGDGTLGLLPEEWLARWGLAALGGEREGDALRFGRAQALWLDALLPREELDADARFAQLREELAGFSRLEPRREPRGFGGTLRDYQRLALGWIALLRRFGLGGCLADDMGLGKTIVVLAALEERRRARKAERGPSLVVVPRSLVTNWTREAERFAPSLVLRRYTGAERAAELDALAPGEVLITTYGTLRRDAEQLAAVEFDLLVLDEAQAIKNAASQTARAARTLRGRQRLALSGTPVEDHLGELGSLLGFLDPALARRKRALELLDPRVGDDRSAERGHLMRALRPLFLRRTKAEVLPELPEKSEQILWCELGGAQRRAYDQLRLELRRELLSGDGERGWKLSALEALLRLRQAACHPALIDASLAEAGSAKLEQLLLHLEDARESGHKAVVFSQFTGLLAHVRAALDERELTYEYLDGRTRRRAERVERFQTDPACPFFLVSLKAGGVGLNLTAADHVFLLDPWWNPAVEAQAIDRAHRLGRTSKVIAWRLIARDTIEEKVLDLQAEKRELVSSILGEGGALLRQLTREDLKALLG